MVRQRAARSPWCPGRRRHACTGRQPPLHGSARTARYVPLAKARHGPWPCTYLGVLCCAVCARFATGSPQLAWAGAGGAPRIWILGRVGSADVRCSWVRASRLACRRRRRGGSADYELRSLRWTRRPWPERYAPSSVARRPAEPRRARARLVVVRAGCPACGSVARQSGGGGSDRGRPADLGGASPDAPGVFQCQHRSGGAERARGRRPPGVPCPGPGAARGRGLRGGAACCGWR